MKPITETPQVADGFCLECGVELPGKQAHAQSIARMRFTHHHDCPFHPSFQFRRRVAILQAAAVIYAAGQRWPAEAQYMTNGHSRESAALEAEALLAAIAVETRGAR